MLGVSTTKAMVLRGRLRLVCVGLESANCGCTLTRDARDEL